MVFPPFKDNQIEPYKASINLKGYFESNPRLRSYQRYTVVWYSTLARNFADNSELLIRVVLFNIDDTNPYFQPELEVPFSAISKMPIGSIWKNGICDSKFVLDEFEITLGDSAEYDHSEGKRVELNEYLNGVYPVYKMLENEHSIIRISNVGANQDTILIHPVLFFIAHFGYSMEIKRVLMTLNWGLENNVHYSHGEDFISRCLLNYRDESYQQIPNLVYLPKKFVIRDSVLLHFIKTSDHTRNVVRDFNQNIRTQLRTHPYKAHLKIKPWHDDYIQVLFEGTRLDANTILCTSIKGISEPDFIDCDEINVVASPSFKNPVEGINEGKDIFFYPVKKREQTEDIALNPDHPANNMETATVRQAMKILGKKIAMKMHQQKIEAEQAGTKHPLYGAEPSSYASGNVSNSRGDIGYAAFCFEDVEPEKTKGSRIQKLWGHAKALSGSNEPEKAKWFTYRLGFNSSDDYQLMSLMSISKGLSPYPQELIVIRVVVDKNVYYILDSHEKVGTDSGMSGVIIIVADEKQFLDAENDEGLLAIIVSINNYPSGSLPKEFIDAFEGRLSTFKHTTAINDDNNWILTGVNKINDALHN